MLKLILLLFWVDWGPIYPKMSGAKFFYFLTPSGALFDIGALRTTSKNLVPDIFG